MNVPFGSDQSDRDLRSFAYLQAGASLIDPLAAQALGVQRQSFPEKLISLEEFIDSARQTHDVPILLALNSAGEVSVSLSPLAKRYFAQIPTFIRAVRALSSEFVYNPHVMSFIRTAEELGLLSMNFDWGSAIQSHLVRIAWLNNKTAADVFNELVEKLRTLCRSKAVRAEMRYIKSQARRLYRSCKKYVDSIFKKYKRVLVIRLELFYRPEIAHSVSIEAAMSDIDHFLDNQRCNAIFNGMVGYVIKAEYGVSKGVHFHALIFLDGDVRHGLCIEHSAKVFGEYFKSITKGRGDYWNRNERKNIASLDRRGIRGIGLIHADDEIRRDNLTNRVLVYLCKSDQFFLHADGSQIRRLRKGEDPAKKLPKISRKKRSQRSLKLISSCALPLVDGSLGACRQGECELSA